MELKVADRVLPIVAKATDRKTFQLLGCEYVSVMKNNHTLMFGNNFKHFSLLIPDDSHLCTTRNFDIMKQHIDISKLRFVYLTHYIVWISFFFITNNEETIIVFEQSPTENWVCLINHTEWLQKLTKFLIVEQQNLCEIQCQITRE